MVIQGLQGDDIGTDLGFYSMVWGFGIKASGLQRLGFSGLPLPWVQNLRRLNKLNHKTTPSFIGFGGSGSV